MSGDKPVGTSAHSEGGDGQGDMGDLPPDLELLTEEDVAEPLSDADMVSDDQMMEPLAIENTEEDETIPITPEGDPQGVLRHLAESLPDKPFGEGDIAMVNSRGQIVHAAGGSRAASADSVVLFRLLLLIGARSRATDVHFEPKNGEYLVRMRLDGIMVDVVRLGI